MAIAPQRAAIGIRRHFTTEGVHPYDQVRWERRDARITNFRDGTVAFEQLGVEVPELWSLNATNILAQKYFRGTLGTPEREWSLKQVADRVVDTITAWGIKDGYFVDQAEAETFRDELKHLVIHQKAAFNSPVWFNIGVHGVPQQGSACQPYDASVSTPEGLVPIGRLVEENAVGAKVLDAHGITRIVAVQQNGRKDVLRIHTKAGHQLDVTPDHLVWRASDERGDIDAGAFVQAGELRPGDLLVTCADDRVDTTEIRSIDAVGEMEVYDIQTESGEYLSGDLRVHNCFILSVEDSMDSILNWYVEEGIIFKGGSGSGVNLSRIRSSHELLKGGGTASGPVSFMRGADASAGTIKSGGKTRRAAKMLILDADHPDIENFIWCKALEERKARVLRDAGFDMDLDGADSYSIQYQNGNNSVRVTDEFMQAVVDDADWELTARTDGSVIRRLRARDLFRQIAHAAWECADPGMQFDSTINKWHTAPNTGRINGSNPCCFVGDTQIMTKAGLLTMAEIQRRCEVGDGPPSVLALDPGEKRLVERGLVKAWVAGHTRELVDVVTRRGRFRCTPEHRFLTHEGYVEAADLRPGTVLESVGADDSVVVVERVSLADEVPVFDMEVDELHNFVVASTSTEGVVVSNSEYMHLDNSACNLASLNLLQFLDGDGSFDVDGFKAAVEVVFTAQEIIVGNADYPTEKIAENSRKFRELGIGYANLGALLMANGLPYDSDAGRAWAGAITSLMTGHAYATSARTASRMGPFAGFHENAEPMVNVLRMHQSEASKIDEELVPPELLSAAQEAWDEAVELAEQYGVRNSQASVLAPTGTIGLLMDCDTTGVEPDLGLVKTKKLVGGGTMSIVNHTVPRALRQLGYAQDQVDQILAYIDEHRSIVGAPYLSADHLPVFACSMGDNTIHYSGHVRMMGAVQPFISGAISKCVTGDTLVPTEDGLVRIGSFYEGEEPDSFRSERVLVASLGGAQKTDAFYFGGQRAVRRIRLRSGHKVTGTPNHRLLVADGGELTWKALGEIEVGDEVAVRYGADMWATVAPLIPYPHRAMHGSQQHVRVPRELTEDLAFLLGAYASEGWTATSTWSIRIANSVPAVLSRIAQAANRAFDGSVTVRIRPPENRFPFVEINSKTLVELFELLGCGHRASEKRIPDIVLRAPKAHVLAFLQGLALDAYTTWSGVAKWAIRLDSPALLDDLQSVLTNLGVVHGRIAKLNETDGKSYDEVYASGPYAQKMMRLVPFVEPEKADAAEKLIGRSFAESTADAVPGLPGRDGLHLSPVVEARDAGQRVVYDLSVPHTHAFVGNGIVNHNTVNMPEDVTVEDVERLHIDAWKLGIKAVAVYRDNCKVAQPLSTTKKEGALVEGGDAARPGSDAEAKDREVTARIAELEEALEHEKARKAEPVVVGAVRERLPRRRRSNTFAFRVADCEGYVTVGEYEDGRPGEVFVKVSKQGSTLAGIMDAFSISISLGLQHGVPLATYVRKYSNMKFEPAGITDDPELRIASSLVDYIFRRLALDYLSYEERLDLGVLSTSERIQPTLPGVEESATPSVGLVDEGPVPLEMATAASAEAPPAPALRASANDAVTLARAEQRDAPFCYNCGDVMQRAGSCYVCTSCGSTSGCS